METVDTAFVLKDGDVLVFRVHRREAPPLDLAERIEERLSVAGASVKVLLIPEELEIHGVLRPT